MDMNQTKTFENLKKALAGESIARNKYSYFAAVARANGQEHIAAAFEEMARNEMTHARLWFEQVFGMPTRTEDCLMKAAQGEYDEWHSMYPAFAQQARADGLEDIAKMFESVAAIEASHEKRFMTLLLELKKSTQKQPQAEAAADAPAVKKGYHCQFCGAIYEKRPDVCGVCHAIGAFDSVEYTV